MTLKEFEKLDEIDWEKEAELTADPDYKPPQERSGVLQKGWEKINDWILEKSIQIVELAKRTAIAAVKSVVWLIKKIQRFCGSHPTICKIAIITLTVVAFYIAIAFLFENEAQAKLYRGKKPVSDSVVDVLKGELSDIIDSRDKGLGGKDNSELYKLLANIDEMHQSKEKHDFLNSKEKADKILEYLYDNAQDMWRGEGSYEKFSEKERKDIVMRWGDIGSRIKAWYNEVTIKYESGFSQSIEMGKSIAKKAGEAGKEAAEAGQEVYYKVRQQRN